jgi:hypothetical protein
MPIYFGGSCDLGQTRTDKSQNQTQVLGDYLIRVERKVGREVLRSTPTAHRVRSRGSMRFRASQERLATPTHHLSGRASHERLSTPSRRQPVNLTIDPHVGVTPANVSPDKQQTSPMAMVGYHHVMGYMNQYGQSVPSYNDTQPNTPTHMTPGMGYATSPNYYWPQPFYYPGGTNQWYGYPTSPVGNLPVPLEDPFAPRSVPIAPIQQERHDSSETKASDA